jgi:hypothetical protein
VNLAEAIAILTEFQKVAGPDATMSISSFNLQARVETQYDNSFGYNAKQKRATTYQVIASYPQANNYDHIPQYRDKENA